MFKENNVRKYLFSLFINPLTPIYNYTLNFSYFKETVIESTISSKRPK